MFQKRRYVKLAVTLFLGFQCFGCAATFWCGNKATTLRLGMTAERAQKLLGQPQNVMRQQTQGLLIETWQYMDKTLTFHNGVLQTWSGSSSCCSLETTSTEKKP